MTQAQKAIVWLVAPWILIFICVWMLGCTPRPVYLPDDETRALNATLDAWKAAGLGDPGNCLKGTRVEWAKSDEDFLARCSATIGLTPHEGALWGISAKTDAACVAYYKETRPPTTFDVPYALLRKGQPLFDKTGGPAVHEWLHAIYFCKHGPNFSKDWYDSGHNDPKVWTDKGGAASAQGRAAALLGY